MRHSFQEIREREWEKGLEIGSRTVSAASSSLIPARLLRFPRQAVSGMRVSPCKALAAEVDWRRTVSGPQCILRPLESGFWAQAHLK